MILSLATGQPHRRPVPQAKAGGLDVILHIGAHRTALGSFHALLGDNRARLSAAGVETWTPSRTRNGLMSTLFRHPQSITLTDECRAARSCGVMRIAQAEAANAGVRHLIVSDPAMAGSRREMAAARLLYPLVGERLMRFAPAFEGQSVRLVLTIRALDGFWTSLLAARVMAGARVPSKADLDQLLRHRRRWRHVVEEAAAAVPRAKIVVMPHERFASRPEAQLEAMLGRPLAGLNAGAHRINGRPSLAQMRAVAELRPHLPAEGILPRRAEAWTPFSPDQLAELALIYQADLSWLRSQSDQRIRFIEDLNAPASWHGVANQTGPIEPAASAGGAA